MTSISYLKPLREACNITNVNHVTSKQRECLRDSARKRVKTFVGVTITFTKVISKLLRQQKFCRRKKKPRRHYDGICRRKFRGLQPPKVFLKFSQYLLENTYD